MFEEPLAKLITFLCFGLWLSSMLGFGFLTIYEAKKRGKCLEGNINLHDPVDLLLVFSGVSWITMWCFRTMY